MTELCSLEMYALMSSNATYKYETVSFYYTNNLYYQIPKKETSEDTTKNVKQKNMNKNNTIRTILEWQIYYVIIQKSNTTFYLYLLNWNQTDCDANMIWLFLVIQLRQLTSLIRTTGRPLKGIPQQEDSERPCRKNCFGIFMEPRKGIWWQRFRLFLYP